MRAALLGILLCAGTPAFAGQADAVRVHSPWLRAMPPGADMSAAFLRLSNTGKTPVRLVGAESAAAGSVELHGHSHEGGVMRMRAVEGLDLPAGGELRLEPHGLHLMVFELKASPKPGERFPLMLRFADGSRLNVDALVRSPLE
jgi:copper(I)-binding protein